MPRTLIRCLLLLVCTLVAAPWLPAEEADERNSPLANRLESLRRNLIGEGGEHPSRRQNLRSPASRGERTPLRSRQTAEEADPVAAEPPQVTQEPGNISSRRMPGGMVEQPEATPAQSSRRRPAAAVLEESPTDAKSTDLPPARENASAAPAVSPSASMPTDDSRSLLFARKGPLLRAEAIGPQVTMVGKPAAYKVRLQNLGDITAENVAVQVQLPDWAEVVTTQPTRGTVRPPEKTTGGSVVQWQLATLEGRGIDELDMQIVMRRSQRFNLGVSWAAAPTATESTIDVLEPKLELAISGPRDVQYGDTKTYRLTISNPGTGDAEEVGIQLMPIDGGAQPAAVQSIGTIAAGQSKALEIELTARRAGTIKINAIATANNGLKSEAVEEVLVRRAGLKIDVASPAMKYAGTPCNYTIQVNNPGDAAAQKITVEAALPAGANKPEPSAGGVVSEDGTKVSWSIDSLAAGQQQVLQLSAVLQSAGANQLRVSATATGDLADNGTATTNVEALADLKLEVSDPTGPVAVGEEAIYEIRVRNRGTTGANAIEAVGFFSEGLEPVRTQGGSGRLAPGQVVFQPIPTLAAGSEVVLKIAAKATKPGNHVFRAEIRCRALGTQLVGEETTLFYQGGGQAAARTAQGPQPTAQDDEPLKPVTR